MGTKLINEIKDFWNQNLLTHTKVEPLKNFGFF